jgi:hypothetical protein
MKKRIENYKNLLVRLTIAQNLQLQKSAKTQILTLTAQVTTLAPVANRWGNDVEKMENAFLESQKSIETADLTTLDKRRDATIKLIIEQVVYYFSNPLDEQEKTYSTALKFIVDTYKSAANKDYESETAYIRNFVGDLRQQTAALAYFSLSSLADRLENDNEAFDALYLARTDALEAKRDRGPLGDLCHQANASFDAMAQFINALLLTGADVSATGTLEKIVDLLNALIHQFTVIYHRHAGITASRPKDKPQEPDTPEEPQPEDPPSGPIED